MDWVFGGFLIASMLHMVEEYFYPGGFMDIQKRLNPRFAPFVTVPMAVIVNGLQLLLCVLVIILGRSMLTFSMSAAALLSINGVVHVLASIRIKGYVPGVITGLALYLPLALYAYYRFINSGELALDQVLITLALGLLYQAVPIAYLAMASVTRQA